MINIPLTNVMTHDDFSEVCQKALTSRGLTPHADWSVFETVEDPEYDSDFNLVKPWVIRAPEMNTSVMAGSFRLSYSGWDETTVSEPIENPTPLDVIKFASNAMEMQDSYHYRYIEGLSDPKDGVIEIFCGS